MASRNSDRPNILFILTDDQGAWALGCAGNSEIRTPNLDRLAATGIRFENFFCVSPVCSPARASILTGRIPSQHGVLDWLRGGNTTSEGALIEYLAGQPGYTEALAEAGYTCGISGKWHLGNSHQPQKGFTFWEVHATGGGPYYGAPMLHDGAPYREPVYVTDKITENALRFLAQQVDTEAPFYLGVHYTAPHSPWDRDNHPKELYDAYFGECAFDSTPQLPMHPWQISSAPYGRDEATRRAILSGYFAAVTAMDAGVGRLIDWLEANGLREDTLIIFSGDNGMNMGHHGIYGKGNGTFPMNLFDTSVKVPVLISRPGAAPQGVVNDDLLSHYDVLPTLLEYLGLPNPQAQTLPGRSFAPLLRGESLLGREHVIVFDEYGPVRMIRSRDWKYIHRYPYGPHEFYDLTNDPDEAHNLIDSAEHQARIAEMKGALDAWFLRYVDPAVDGTREPVTGKGQTGWAGPAGRGKKVFADDWRYLSEVLKDEEGAQKMGPAFI
ncbi:MAG: sulfatase-like hydrolase/transferase [Anaerolineae bacterium]|nr:sulfatase-like hydrolase/transferase [Anaerolineae bacterium]